jgi:hypothetical protein
MTIQSAKWLENGTIERTDADGTIKCVPNYMGNRDRRELDEWEKEGNTIEAFIPEPRTTGTAREFMDLFTPTEKLAIVNLSMSNAEIKLWYDEALAGDVWLGHANVTSGLLAMQGAGVITAERAAEILATDFNA